MYSGKATHVRNQLLIVQLLCSFNIWRYLIDSKDMRNELGIHKAASRVSKPDIWKQQQMAELSYKFESLQTYCFCFSYAISIVYSMFVPLFV